LGGRVYLRLGIKAFAFGLGQRFTLALGGVKFGALLRFQGAAICFFGFAF